MRPLKRVWAALRPLASAFASSSIIFASRRASRLPKKLANEEAWVTRLREAVKEQHRNGYSLREKRGAVQVQRYWADSGKRESASLPIVWERGCERRMLNATMTRRSDKFLWAAAQSRRDLLLPIAIANTQSKADNWGSHPREHGF